MISLVRNLTFYVVAWLCLSGFLVPFAQVVQAGNPCYPPSGKFCTYTQQQYGDASSPAAALLTSHFPTLFPNGLAIGADVYLNVNNLVCSVLNLVGGLLDAILDLVFYTVDDIINYLPQVGHVVQPLVDGTTFADAPANSLAGNTLALAINLALDANVALFSPTTAAKLTDLYVVAGPCAGLSVAAVLNIANQFLGNTVPLPLLGASPLFIGANIDLCVANINNNFVAASAAHNYLVLPGLNLQAFVNVWLGLGLPAITADIDASLTVRGSVLGLPLSVLLNVDAHVATFKAWRTSPTHSIAASSPVPLQGLLWPLPSVVGGLLDGVVSLVGGLLDVVLDDTLCLVNYLLNHKPLNARLVDIQAAIFLLLNPGLNVYALLNLGINCNPQLVLAILADVQLNGVGFLPAPGQIAAVFANVQLAGAIDAKVLLEVNLPLLGLNVDADICIAL